MKKTVGITGYNGFVGRGLISKLIDDNEFEEITLIGRNTPIQNDSKINWIKFDLSNQYHGVGVSLDLLIHLAGKIKKDINSSEFKEYYDANCFGTFNLLRNFNTRHLIYISTVDVYGNKQEEISEHHKVKPIDAYSISKYFGELVSKYLLGQNRVTILRLGNVYGSSDDSLKLISTVFRKFARGQKVTIIGDGNYTRDYIYIDDVLDIINIFTQKKVAGIFNVVTGNSNRIIDVVETIRKLYGIDNSFLEFVSSSSKQASIKFNNSKLLSVLGPYHFKQIGDGLSEIYEYKKNIL